MRVTTIALPGLLLLLSTASPANSTNFVTGLSQAKATVELSATTKKKPKKMKKEKVEYMRSAAPPEKK